MPNNTLSYLLQHTNHNGVSIFVAGLLLTLSLYHFLLYFQHKDKAYLYYSLFTFLIFVFIYHRASHFFLVELSQGIKPFLYFIHFPIQWLFNTVYLLFVITFIDLETTRPKWNKFLKYAITFYLIVLVIISLYAYIADSTTILGAMYAYFFLPTITVVAVITMYVLYTMDTVLKHYVLVGSFVYLSLSLTAFYLAFFEHYFIGLFYIAVIIESIFFALGLGAKQKILLLAKNEIQEKVIAEHELNSKLQEEIKTKLAKEVALKTEEILQLTSKNKIKLQRKLALAYSKQTLDLRMRALQTQMNPHFLFNSLNSIKHYIIKNNKKDATYFLSKLAMFIRKILDSSRLKEITLQEEVNIMQLYLEVENIRLRQRIQFDVKIDNSIDLTQIKIPPLVLQPFIENAIWHGLSLRKGLKTIQMNIAMKNKVLQISITDNGIGREHAAKHKDAKLVAKESLGIALTKERLLAFTSHKTSRATISFEDLYDKEKAIGTKVLVQIPL